MRLKLALLRQNAAPAVVVFCVAALFGNADWVQRVENLTLDMRTRLRTRFQPEADPRVVVLGIDDDSLSVYGVWPWRRNVHGTMLMSVANAQPAVVAWDILFTEPSEYDMALVVGAKQLPGRVIFAAYGSDEASPPVDPTAPPQNLPEPIQRVEGDASKLYSMPGAALPVPRLREVGLTAFVDTPPGSDGVRRVAPLLVRIDGQVYPTLGLQTALRFWGLTVADVRVRPGDAIYVEAGHVRRRIPIDETGGYLVNYRQSFDTVHKLSYAQVVTNFTGRFALGEKFEVPDVTGRILLVGQMSTGLADVGPTPFSPLTPLVLVHANVIENMLREDYARPVGRWPVLIVGISVGVAGVMLLQKRRLGARAVFAIAVPLLYTVAAAWIWISHSIALPVVWPVLGFLGLEVFGVAERLLAEQRAKEEIKGMFGTYVSPALVNRMIDSGEKPRLGGYEGEITAYFSDIQGFSTISEELPPDRLVELMNEYLTACTDIVQEEGGTLDKYIGDAVVAMFGAPIALPDHAYRACVATQRVQARLGELREQWRREGDRWPQLVSHMQSRIGLNSGECIIGNMGSRTRFNYTMMGDNVNLAARMESGAKSWGVYTMCTEATKLACEQHGGDRVVFRALGRIVVKGRSQPVPIYEIVGLKETVTARTRECIGIFEAGLRCYYEQAWDAALARFRASSELEPNTPGETPGVGANPSAIYVELVTSFRTRPPPAGWDGVYVMKEK